MQSVDAQTVQQWIGGDGTVEPLGCFADVVTGRDQGITKPRSCLLSCQQRPHEPFALQVFVVKFVFGSEPDTQVLYEPAYGKWWPPTMYGKGETYPLDGRELKATVARQGFGDGHQPLLCGFGHALRRPSRVACG